MVFKLSVKTEDKFIPVPFIAVEIYSDDTSTSKETVSADSDGSFYIKTCCKRDGFVRIIARALDENKEKIEGIDEFQGGAGADVDKITLCSKAPDDYFEYWEDLSAKAQAIPKKILLEREIPAPEGFIAKDMRFETTAGEFLSLVVSYPKDAEEGTLKLRMLFMGYGINTALLRFDKDSLNVGVNSHDIGNLLDAAEYQALRAEPRFQGYGFNAEENKDPRTSYWNKMYTRDLQAFHYFKNHPLLNGKDYIFLGGSQGAMQAAHMALHSKIATECHLDVAWCCDLWAAEKENRMSGWRPGTGKAMEDLDTAVAASLLTCPVHIMAGLGDYVCPPSGQAAMFNAIKSKKFIKFVQNQTHPYRPVEVSAFTFTDKFIDE